MHLPQLLRKKANSLRLQQLAYALADVLAPARCIHCLREGKWLCERCRKDLPLFSQQCIVCVRPQHAQGSPGIRGASPRGATCVRHHNETPLTGVISAGRYGSDYIRRGVQWLKFRGIIDVSETLASLIAPQLPLVAPLPFLQTQAVLIPIPLHARRLKARGFNQSLAIAEHLSAHTGIPLAHLLKRARATWAQTELPHEMRQENVEEAFEVKQLLPDAKYFLLLDDVTTTGSTLSAAAKVLKDAGASQVWGVTVARG